MSAAVREGSPSDDTDARFRGLANEMGELRELVKTGGQKDKLSLIVFSGSLDRLIAAFVLATGAAAMGMQVSMFFTFWGTSALRRQRVRVKKTLVGRLFGWMLPSGSKKLPL